MCADIHVSVEQGGALLSTKHSRQPCFVPKILRLNDHLDEGQTASHVEILVGSVTRSATSTFKWRLELRGADSIGLRPVQPLRALRSPIGFIQFVPHSVHALSEALKLLVIMVANCEQHERQYDSVIPLRYGGAGAAVGELSRCRIRLAKGVLVSRTLLHPVR